MVLALLHFLLDSDHFPSFTVASPSSPTATDHTFVGYAGPYVKTQKVWQARRERMGELLPDGEGGMRGRWGEHDYYQLSTPPSSLYVTLFVSGGGGERREEGKRSGVDGGSRRWPKALGEPWPVFSELEFMMVNK
ncbi:hypothetical protein K438DRAFT_1770213 [Mycena galopus ATCC 62051]|nr:hypothetical protein K438DRAFT_1770213 [Mycena galopus ATCC 62051]